MIAGEVHVSVHKSKKHKDILAAKRLKKTKKAANIRRSVLKPSINMSESDGWYKSAAGFVAIKAK